MSDFYLIMAMVALAVLIPLIYLWRSRRIPRGWYLGPKIRGENRSEGELHIAPEGGWIHVLGEPHYITIGCGPLTGKQVRLRWRFAGKAYPVEDPSAPALLTLHFQRKGDDWRARNGTEFYRWYSIERWPLEFTERPQEAIVRLEPHFWTGVRGDHAALHRERFLEALENADRIGLCFGWRGGAGHGVKGTGYFQLLEFEIEPLS